MSVPRVYLNAVERAAVKQSTREADAHALAVGDKTLEQLRLENSHFREIAHEPIQWETLRRRT